MVSPIRAQGYPFSHRLLYKGLKVKVSINFKFTIKPASRNTLSIVSQRGFHHECLDISLHSNSLQRTTPVRSSYVLYLTHAMRFKSSIDITLKYTGNNKVLLHQRKVGNTFD